ncbi:ABC transporter ATP-binding protein, partial [Nocardia aurea]|uniref:ABC transporter ATP-binding protein n=1 Tax=Nocardia aurea TaxID=2144174 RepID=UPI0018E57CB9
MRPVWLVVARLIRFDLRRYLIGALLWMPVSVIPLVSGLVLRELFDQISGQRAAGPAQALWLCAAFVGVEVVRGLVLVTAWTYGVYWWCAAATLLRANVLRSVLTARGAAASRLPHSPGESVARLRDDVSDLVNFTDESVPLAGGV